MPRIPLITATLDKISAAYAANGKLTTTASGGSGGSTSSIRAALAAQGTAISRTTGPGNTSSQQTASGTWGQLTVRARPSMTRIFKVTFRWLQKPYSYTTNARYDGWPNAYFYYLWSSSKAYNIIQNSGVPADPGNSIRPTPACPALAPCRPSGPGKSTAIPRSTRVRRRAEPAARASTAEPRRAGTTITHRLMSLQQASGYFPNPNGPWNPAVDHAYAILVLQRSEGGACADSDSDGVCDNVDNCPSVANPGQENTLR